MVSVKKLLIATTLFLGEIAAAPFPDNKLSVASSEARSLDDFVINSRSLNDHSVVDIEVSKDKRDTKSKTTKPKTTTPTTTKPKTSPAKTSPKAAPKTSPKTAPATKCKTKRPRNLQRRGLRRAADPNDIDEHEYVMASSLKVGKTASVTNLSGCTALFFWDMDDIPSVFHIFCGREEVDAYDAAERADELGLAENGVSIVAAKDANFDAAVKGIHKYNKNIKIIDEPNYDAKLTQGGSMKRWKITATAGSKRLSRALVDGCSKQAQ